MNAVDIHDLTYRYPNGAEALRGISCTVAEGECLGLIGPNGAGKSTLLLHLNGILPGEGGGASAVRIFGEAISRDTLDTLRREVGFLFQNPDDQLFCPTVFEDVAFGPRQTGLSGAALRARVETALNEVGLKGMESQLPHHLSQGEKRRVCLAGVLACAPRLLALDEPTGDLDPRGRRRLIEWLQSFKHTKIVATHDLELVVELCSRAILLDGGRIVAEGPTVELLNDEPLMLAHGLERPHSLRHRHPH